MNSSPHQAVIFDFDDTLVQAIEVKWAQHKAVAQEYYQRELSDDTLRQYWGMPFDALVQTLHHQADTLENLHAAYVATNHRFPKTIQPGVHDTLLRLHEAGYTLGIISAMNREGVIDDLSDLDIDSSQFFFVQGANDTAAHKPDPAVFRPALKRLSSRSITAQRTLYVGDALSDFYAASRAGLDFIGVTTGLVSGHEFKLAGAKYVSSLAKLTEQLIGPKAT